MEVRHLTGRPSWTATSRSDDVVAAGGLVLLRQVKNISIPPIEAVDRRTRAGTDQLPRPTPEMRASLLYRKVKQQVHGGAGFHPAWIMRELCWMPAGGSSNIGGSPY